MTTPNIVVADGFTLNPGDLDWSALEHLGKLVVYERSGADLLARCADAEIVLTNKEVFDGPTIQKLPNLRYISVLATGTNVVDLTAAHEHGIVVSNVPAYSSASVAEHVFALLFALNNQVAAHSRAASDGSWTKSGHFSFRLGPIRELSGQTMGIVGLGNIGRRVAIIADALGMHVVAANQRSKGQVQLPFGVEWLELSELAARVDFVSLHCPLTTQTERLVNQDFLRRMKPSAILLNTGRGQLVDEAALAAALQAGEIAGAGLDVLCSEPPPADHPLLGLSNCLVTPHLAWATVEARARLLAVTVENVRTFLEGHPQNVVSGQRINV